MKPLLRLVAACMLGLLLTGCAAPPTAMPPGAEPLAYWRGRLALRVESEEPASYFASFELSGQAQAGELLLSTPLGTTLARLHWRPRLAQLTREGQTRVFDTLDTLATEATGTAIPIAALFQWLQGQPAAADGWQADLSLLSEGRIVARRQLPAPAAELRLIIEQP